MSKESKLDKAFGGISSRFQSLDGAVVGKDLQSAKVVLGKDEKGAMVNNIVDKYLKQELTNEYLEQVKAEYLITTREIMREIARRQIEKAMEI